MRPLTAPQNAPVDGPTEAGDAVLQVPPAGTTTASSVVPADEITARRRRAWRDCLLGLVATLAMLPVTEALGHGSIGRALSLATYEWLHGRLTSDASPVVVADITGLPFTTRPDGRPVTSRVALRSILHGLAECSPTAIAIDIDFSPLDGKPYDVDDPDFLKFCDGIRRGAGSHQPVPLFLGVHRARELSPRSWLCSADYEDMAVSVLVPRHDNRRLPLVFKMNNMPRGLPSMSLALATAHLRSHESAGRDPVASPYPEWFAHRLNHVRSSYGFEATEYLVNFAPIDDLVRYRVRVSSREDVLANDHRFRGHMVLIGGGNPDEVAEVTLSTPARRGTYPGVYVHACGAATLTGRPLFELTRLGRTLLDLGVSVAVFGGLLMIRLWYSGRRASDIDSHRLELLLNVIMICLAVTFGVIWVDATRVLWDDLPIVLLGITIHGKLQAAASAARRTWNMVVSGRTPTGVHT